MLPLHPEGGEGGGEGGVLKSPRTRVVGRPYAKVDAAAKVTGQTKFADDMVLPRMLHCKLLRSKIAHARIVSIDVSRALAAAGRRRRRHGQGPSDPVRDPPGLPGRARALHGPRALRRRSGRGRRGGRRGRGLRRARSRSRSGTRRCRRSGRSTMGSPPRRRRSTTTATPATSTSSSRWSSATRRKASRAPTASTTTSSSTRATRTCPSSSTRPSADFGPDGKLTLWSSTQTPHYVHRALAKVLGMPAAQIRVIATPNGGGFGGKSDPFNHEIVVAHLSRVTGRPGQDLPDARGGLLLPPRPAPDAHAREDRRHEGRRDHGAALPDRPRRRRLRLLRRRLDLLHGRAADRDVRGAGLPLRRRARLHEQAAVRPQARPRHAAAALRAGGRSSTGSPATSASTRPRSAATTCSPRTR